MKKIILNISVVILLIGIIFLLVYFLIPKNINEEKIEVSKDEIVFELSKKELVLYIGEKSIIKPLIISENASNKKFIWKSKDESIASVNNEGVVFGISEGLTEVIVEEVTSKVTAVCKVKVLIREVEKIELSEDNITLIEGEIKKLNAVLVPSNATKSKIYYESSDKDIIEVNDEGEITGKKAGNAEVIVRDEDNKVEARCSVEVRAKENAKLTEIEIKELKLNKTNLILNKGSSEKLTVTINPGNATNKSVTWTSSDSSIATVSDGNITAKKAGKVTITVASSNGIKAICTVTVKEKITYKEVRYNQGDGLGTNIWYAIIPNYYKMYYAYATNTVYSYETPSSMAKKVDATIAVNAQLLGFPLINGVEAGFGTNVSGYNFIVKQNPNFDGVNIGVPPWKALIVTATKDYSQGISFKDINLGFNYDGDHILCNNKNIYLALFHQIIKDGSGLITYPLISKDTPYYQEYYSDQFKYKNTREPRTWIAYDSKGNQFVAVATGRNWPLGSGENLTQAGLSFNEIIDVTRKYFTNDIVTLYNIDGGKSSAFVYKGNKLNVSIDSNGNRYERKVMGIFYWKIID